MTSSDNDNINFNQANELLEGFIIPSQPKILTACIKAHPDIDKIAELVNHDPPTAAAILKTVNSAVFNLERSITSVQEAIVIMGLNSVMNVLNAVSLRTAIKSTKRTRSMEEFWHSTTEVAVAMAAVVKWLAINTDDLRDKIEVTPDVAYCTGLFHHCGMPIIYEKYANYFAKIQRSFEHLDEKLTETENNAFSTNHAVMGYYVTKSWNLPESLCEVIRLHHDVKVMRNLGDQENEVGQLLAILKIAEHIIGEPKEFGGGNHDTEWGQAGKKIQAYLKVNESEFNDMANLVWDHLEKSSQVFDK